MKKRVFTVIITVFMILNLCTTAFANSGPSYWEGSDATGVIISDENCPLIVEKEVLDFDLNQFPAYYSSDEQNEINEYTGSFTANYTFYNPESYDVTVKIAFPFGTMPQYTDVLADFADSEKYNVTVNGQDIDKQIRFTKMNQPYKFDFETELPTLTEEYIKDDFYSPDMRVTKYIIEPVVESTKENRADIYFKWDSRLYPDTVIMPVSFGGYKTVDGTTFEMNERVYEDEKLIIYAIGKPLDKMPQFTFANKDGEISGSVNITSSEMTLKQLIMEYSERNNRFDMMSETDIYNIALTYLKSNQEFYASKGIVSGLYSDVFYSGDIMGWYVYEMTVPAQQKVENSVKGLIWPSVHLKYNPHKYEYTYLLSPAQNWADFRDIEININTPFYMLETNQNGFEKTENGFTYKSDSLPEGELNFTLCSAQNPEKESNSAYKMLIFIWVFLPVGLFVGIIVLFVVLIKNTDRKKKQ